MSILHIIGAPETGEAERYAADLILHFKLNGVDQEVIIAEESPQFFRLKSAGIQIKPLTRFRKLLLRFGSRKKLDILHAWTPNALSFVVHLANKTKPTVITSADGYYDPRPAKRGVHFVAATPSIAEHLTRNKIAADHIKVIPHFVSDTPKPPLSRTSYATPKDSKILLSLSKLHPYRGHDTLLKALVDLPNCVLWFAGDGPQRTELDMLARNLNISERVRFVGDTTDRTALTRTADVVVLTTRQEAFNNIIPETWAAGSPLIVCRKEAAENPIEDGVNGLLVPIDNTPALRDAVQRVLNDEPLRRRLIAHGYAAYVKDYTKESVIRQWIQLYRTLSST